MSRVVKLQPAAKVTDRNPDEKLLISAAKLLRVSAATFTDRQEPWFTTNLADIREVVTIAMERLDQYLDTSGPSSRDATPVYDAEDVLTLVQAALLTGMSLSNGKTCCPLAGAMRVAAALLEEFAS